MASMSRMEMQLKLHPSGFGEIYHERNINNIYFDYPGFDNYFANIRGNSRRVKYRIRWYGDIQDAVESGTLEFKIRAGTVNAKLSYPLISFSVQNIADEGGLADLLEASNVPAHVREELLYTRPTLINRYTRKYYQSYCKKYRFTVDTNMTYHRTASAAKAVRGMNDVVPYGLLELKYAVSDDVGARDVTRVIPFRSARHSKYVMGVQRLWT